MHKRPFKNTLLLNNASHHLSFQLAESFASVLMVAN